MNGKFSFKNPAQYGLVKFYALHEREDEYRQELASMMRFLPGCVDVNTTVFILKSKDVLEDLCTLGLFEANPEKLVVAMAFVITATTLLKRAYPLRQTWPANTPFWKDWNAMTGGLADSLSPELGTDRCIIIHKLYQSAKILKAL